MCEHTAKFRSVIASARPDRAQEAKQQVFLAIKLLSTIDLTESWPFARLFNRARFLGTGIVRVLSGFLLLPAMSSLQFGATPLSISILTIFKGIPRQ